MCSRTVLTAVMLLLAAAGPALTEEKKAPWEDKATLEKAFAEACDVVEDICGAKFEKRPRVVVSDAKTVFHLLEDDVAFLLKLGHTPGELMIERRTYAQLLLAKYDPETHAVHLVPETLARVKQAHLEGGFTRDHLRVLLAHEATHAMDFPRHGLAARRDKLASQDSALAFGAMVEGHAQWVAEQAARRWKASAAFRQLTEVVLGSGSEIPKGVTPSQLDAMATIRFSYGEGHAFFTAVHAAEGPKGVERAMREPPTRTALIERPALWLDPEGASEQIDLAPVLATFPPLVSESPWVVRSQRLLSTHLDGLKARAPKKHRAGFLAGLESAHTTIAAVAGEGAGLVMLVAAFDSEMNARAFFDTEEAIQSGKQKAPGGGKILSTEKRPGAGLKGRLSGHTRVLVLGTAGERSEIRHALFRVGRVVCELLSMNVPAMDAGRFDAVVDRLGASIEDPEAAAALPPLEPIPFESTVPVLTVRIVDEDGTPVPLCDVILTTEEGKTTSYQRQTGAKGQCRLLLREKGKHHVLVFNARTPFSGSLGLAPSEAVAVKEGVKEFTITLAKGKVVEGRVLDVGGKPVADVAVLARPRSRSWREHSGSSEAITTRTGVDGRFQLAGVDDGPWELRLQRGEAELLAKPYAFAASDTPIELRLAALSDVVVTVVDNDGKPLRRVEVTAWPSERGEGARRFTVLQTDADGKVVLRGLDPKGTYSLNVGSRLGGRSGYVGKTVPKWRPADTRVALEQGWTLTVQVVDESGKPARGTVALRSRGSTTHRDTDAMGRVVVRGLPRDGVSVLAHRPEVRDPWQAREAMDWTAVKPTADPVNITLQRPDPKARVRVRIETHDGAPVPSVTLRLEVLTERGGVRSSMSRRVEGGSHDFLRPDGPFRLRALRAQTSGGKPLPYGPALTSRYPAHTNDALVLLPAGRRVQGTVVDTKGLPLGGVTVEARVRERFMGRPSPRGALIDEAATDDEGRFEFVRLGDEPYDLFARGSRGLINPEGTALARDATKVRIETPTATSIRVLDPQGEPLAGARVNVTVTVRPAGGGWGQHTPVSVATDAGGRAAIASLAPGQELTLKVHPPNGRSDLLPHVVAKWDGQPVGEIRLELGVVFRGRVLLDGKPAAGADIMAELHKEETVEHMRWESVGRTREDGSFETRLLPRRATNIRAKMGANDWRILVVRSPVAVMTVDEPEVTLEAKRGPESVTLRVPGVKKGTEGWFVRTGGDGTESCLAFTFAADGETTVRGLLKGTWRVYIPSVDGGSKCALRENVSVPAKVVEMTLVKTVTLRFRLEAPAGSTDVTGTARDPAYDWREAKRREDGVYEVKGMPPGRWTVGGYADFKGGYAEGKTRAGPDEVPTVKLVHVTDDD